MNPEVGAFQADTADEAQLLQDRSVDHPVNGADTRLSVVNTVANLIEVEQYWLKYLSGGTKRVGEEEFANLLEDTDRFPGDFQRGLGNLIDAGKVRNLDAPRKRPKNPLHWKKESERLELMDGAV